MKLFGIFSSQPSHMLYFVITAVTVELRDVYEQ